MIQRSLLVLAIFVCIALGNSSGPWSLKARFAGQPSDFQQDRGKSRISNWWTPNTRDDTQGFPGAYQNAPGGQNLFIDSQGYLVLQPTCPYHVAGGECKAVQCNEKMTNGQTCVCNNATVENKWFPWWCQLQWGSAKVISKMNFNLHSSGGLFVFEDVWIPRGKPLWPAIWLLPANEPVYGGQGSPRGGDWAVWPNNGELDILETVGVDPRIYGTLHYSSGNEYNGWPSFQVSANSAAQKGTAYQGAPLTGNTIATRSQGNNPVGTDGHLGTLCFQWFVDKVKGPTFIWYVADGNPVDANGNFQPRDQLDIMLNRAGTNPTFGVTGDGSGAISFGTTPFWPGSKGNSPPLTLYRGWDGKNSYGYQGYYKIQGNVRTPSVGIHDGPVSSKNPHGLRIVPEFDKSGNPVPGTIAELYEPYLCSMIGDWINPHPMPWNSTKCQNPPSGHSNTDCPMTGTGSSDCYNYCWVEGATRPGVGWWSNSPMAKGVPFAPFDPNQNWNIILNVAIGGQWPRGAGQEGDWGKNFVDMSKTNLKMKSISYYQLD